MLCVFATYRGCFLHDSMMTKGCDSMEDKNAEIKYEELKNKATVLGNRTVALFLSNRIICEMAMLV